MARVDTAILRSVLALFVLHVPSTWALVVQKSVRSSNKIVEMPGHVTLYTSLYQRAVRFAPVHFLLRGHEPVSTVQGAAVMTGGEVIGSILIWGTITSIIAYYYHKNHKITPEVDAEVDNEKERGTLTEWKVSPFSCMSDPKVFAFSFCCPSIRWAHTMSMVDILAFWPGFFVFFTLALLNGFTAGLLCWIALAVVCTYYRLALRDKFGMTNNGLRTMAEDCICYAFCTCCLVAQEALHVEAAARCGHTAIVREPVGEPVKESPHPL